MALRACQGPLMGIDDMKMHQRLVGLSAFILAAGSLYGAAPALAQKAKPPTQITVHNLRTAPLTTFEIATAGDQPRLVGKLTRPLAPGQRITIKLSKPVGCSYYVLARFGDEAESDADGMDLCKDKVIRLTE